MVIKEIETKKVETVTDIICDCCGESCKTVETQIENDKRVDNGETYRDFEYMTLSSLWGYNSNKDCESWTAQICESCVDKHLKNIIKFNIKK